MKTFSYSKVNLVNNSAKTVNANIKALNDLVWHTWRFRYDTVHGCDGYADREFNESTKHWEYSRQINEDTAEAGEICTFFTDTEVKYNESNDMYFINFKFSAVKVGEDGSKSLYKFTNSDSMVIGGKFDEFSLLELNKAFIGFENDNNI